MNVLGIKYVRNKRVSECVRNEFGRIECVSSKCARNECEKELV